MADRKFGRNKRAATNKMQRQRTERNKRQHAEQAHALGIKQPRAGSTSADVYGHQPRINTAAKFLAACMALATARIRRALRT